MNNNSILMFSRNTGTMSVTRDIEMNQTSALHFGGGGSTASASVASNIAWNGTHALTAVNDNPFNFTGSWSGSGTINRSAGGQTLTISGNNTTFSGNLNLGSGTTTLSGQFNAATIGLSAGTNFLSGSFGASTVNVTGGTNTFSGSFGAATLNLGGGSNTFSGDLGTANLNITAGLVVTANSNSALGSGTVTLSATSGTSRVDLNAVTTGASFVLDSSALTGFNGVITAIGSGSSVINGNVTVSRSQGDGGHLRNNATGGGLLVLNGQLNVSGSQSVITHREGVIVYAGGGTTQHILQVTNIARLGADDGLSQGTTLRLGVSGAGTFDMNGFDQTLRALERINANSATVTNSAGTASVLTLNQSSGNLSFSGSINDGSGGVSLIKSGGHTLSLTGTSSYTGATTVSAGTLLISGALGDTDIEVINGAAFGGTGVVGGDLEFASGSFFHIADVLDPLAVSGTITFGSGFGIANIANLNWDSLDLGTAYTLVSTSQSFDESSIANFGFANAATVGNGRFAYFQNGSLQLVVIPEPGSAMLACFAALGLLRRRR